ncbi:hypothetical protein SRB5_13780 [Streptomyces sp. RB5]|uniref:Secreted protein n=1 Tax=Streptomyces smaragdinus TaxID=2585196 RepID=A0A7K0CD44_9ACTN|nr:hypothetical protein [Streptomyces smaragdinus]MQY11263.1 hypothetical protein [Streptomyces smaragdinus]
MSNRWTGLRRAAAATMAAALIGLGAGTANAAPKPLEWPPVQPGAYLYTGVMGSGTVTQVDLDDVGTCHTLDTPVLSSQIVSDPEMLNIWNGPDCTGSQMFNSAGKPTNMSFQYAMWSYRVVLPAYFPPPTDGAVLYPAEQGQGPATEVDLDDVGTCHTLAAPALSYQNGADSADMELFAEAGCGIESGRVWRAGETTGRNLEIPGALSYRVVPAADWPAFKEGAYLYSGTNGTGTETEVDIHADPGTCHTLAAPVLSDMVVVEGNTHLELFTGTDCTSRVPGLSGWRTGTLAMGNFSWAMRSYRLIPL